AVDLIRSVPGALVHPVRDGSRRFCAESPAHPAANARWPALGAGAASLPRKPGEFSLDNSSGKYDCELFYPGLAGRGSASGAVRASPLVCGGVLVGRFFLL